jgi:DNA-binding CsgD family transcriptional regulator
MSVQLLAPAAAKHHAGDRRDNAPDGHMIGRMAVRVSSPVLIGRTDEFDRLQDAIDRARAGDHSSILIAGEAGVGKTRLVAEFAESARGAGFTVLQGGCVELGEGALPYAPVVEAFRGLVRREDAADLDVVLGHGRSELARLLPDLGPVADGPASGLGIGSAQGRLFELLLGVFERLAARAPVALIAEDLHWSDRSTRDLLGFLVRNLRHVPAVVVLTYRSDELHRRHPLLPFLAELGRTGFVERIELEPFDLPEAAAQLRAIAGREVEDGIVASIHARSGGNAFFAEELLVAAGDDEDADLPPTLRDVLLARVARLAEPTQDFLRIASAAGQRVDPALVATAAGLDDAALYDALRESVGRQVLVPDPTAGTERYAFRHALLQEAVYDDLLPGERTRLHAAFAQTLEARSAGDASYSAELAYHWYAAHDLPRALECAVAAGIDAEARYAFPEALAQYERAVELWDQVPDAETRAGRDRIDLLGTAASVARFHEAARAATLAQTAIRYADQAGDALRAGLLNERLGRYAWIAGQGEVSQRAHQAAMRLIPPEPPSEARARAVAGRAQIVMLSGRFAESRVLAEEALTLARAVGARDIEGHALNTRGLDRGVGGDVSGAIEDLQTALAIGEETGIVDDIGRAYANWVWVLDVAGRLEEAVAVAELGIATTERLGLVRFFGTHLLCNVADYLYRLGRWDEAEQAIRRAGEAGPYGINEILEQEFIGRLAIARGQWDEAAERLRPLAPVAERASDIQFIEPVQASLAELALWLGRPDDAAARIAAALRLVEHTTEVRIGEIYALGIRANADAAEIARGRRSLEDEAAAVAAGEALLVGIRDRHAEVLTTRPAFAHLSEAWVRLCAAEATRLRREPDPDAWAVTAEVWERLPRPYPAAYARWREAEARLAARGDRTKTIDSLRRARGMAERLGAIPLLREIDGLAGRARLDLGTVVDADGPTEGPAPEPLDDAARFGLTTREREVLSLVALGRTNRQIADELFISTNTAGVHVSNILGKLEVNGRGEAAALAYRLGLVEPTGPDEG